MKVYTTIRGVTGITVQPGTTDRVGKPVRDMVITTSDGELIVRVLGEHREDLQVQFAGSEQGTRTSTQTEPAA